MSDKARIFLISNLYPTEEAPHFGVFVKNFEDGLRHLGHDFPYAALIRGNDGGMLVKIVRYILFYGRIIWRGILGDYDLVYVHFISHAAFPVLIAQFFRRKPLVVNAHGSDVLASGIFQRQLGFMIRKLLKRATLIVVPSGYFCDIVAERFHVPKEKIYVSPSGGINDTVFRPLRKTEAKKHFDVMGHTVLGFVSRIDEGKGWDDLLEALSIVIKNRNIQSPLLLCAGTGEQRHLFEARIRALGLQDDVRYLGLVNHEELVQLYNAMDVFLFPSKREAESLGLVGLEAMACGIPVIASEIGGVPDYLHSGLNGLMIKPKNPEGLAEAIERFFDLPEDRRREMGNHAIFTAQEFFAQRVAERMSEKLDAIAGLRN